MLNQRGFATFEMIPIIVVIAILINFSLGFFGIIQTGILNSIASRNYTYETFRNRTNLMYFHDARDPNSSADNFRKHNTRVHGIASENRSGSDSRAAVVTLRPIGYHLSPSGERGDQSVHEPGPDENRGIFSIQEGARNDSIDSTPVWVRPMYGICLNAKCAQ